MRCISGSTFDCRSRGPWFKDYTGLSGISQGTRNESPRLYSIKVWIGTLRGLCLCKFDTPGHRMLAAHKTGSEIVFLGKIKCQRVTKQLNSWKQPYQKLQLVTNISPNAPNNINTKLYILFIGATAPHPCFRLVLTVK